MSDNSLYYNIHNGMLEAEVHGYRAGILKSTEYNNLAQCDNLDEMKSHLAGTDYGTFLQNEATLTARIITEKALDKLVDEFNELRLHAVHPLSTFLDFITYEYMIANVLKLISGARNETETLELMYKCHPLGMFEGIGALTAATSVDDMYDLVLVDSPIGKFFRRTDKRDFDEFSMEYIRSLLLKNYLESFYDFCMSLGGTTAEIMGEILEFEADRIVITITRNTFGVKELQEDRKKLYPNFGELVMIHDDLAGAQDDDTLRELLRPYTTYYKMFSEMSNEKPLETKFLERAVELNKASFTQQFHFGVFYSYVKLKEQEINNLMWIAECIKQDMKHRINEYVSIYDE